MASPTDWGLDYEEVQDEIVPARLGRRLYAAAPAPKRFVELRGGHNEGFLHSQPQYQAALVSFLDQQPASDAGD